MSGLGGGGGCVGWPPGAWGALTPWSPAGSFCEGPGAGRAPGPRPRPPRGGPVQPRAAGLRPRLSPPRGGRRKRMAESELSRSVNEFLSRLQDDLKEAMNTMMCSKCQGKHK